MTQAEYLVTVYGSLVSIFLGSIYHAIEGIPHIKRDDLLQYLDVLSQLQETGLLERFQDDIAQRVADICDRVRVVASQYYQQKLFELNSAPGVNKALPLLFTTDDIEKCAQQLDKRFPEPFLEYVIVYQRCIHSVLHFYFYFSSIAANSICVRSSWKSPSLSSSPISSCQKRSCLKPR
jgi:hypothetical protein